MYCKEGVVKGSKCNLDMYYCIKKYIEIVFKRFYFLINVN